MAAVLTGLDEVLDPRRAALLVIDMQHDFIHRDGWSAHRDPAAADLRRVVPVINRLIAAARGARVPVCYVTMEHGPQIDAPNYRARYALRGMEAEVLCAAGTWGAALDEELVPPRPDDLRIVRHSYDAFAGTRLHAMLEERGVQSVVGTGVVTNVCVQTTLEHAFALGYYVVAVEDATATADPVVQRVALDNLRRFFGHVVPAETVVAQWRGRNG
jgi:ureidoacrylate peracid hydrolase